jgi:hypothetical protein
MDQRRCFVRSITLVYNTENILKQASAFTASGFTASGFTASGFTALVTTPQYYPGPSKTADTAREIRASSKNIPDNTRPRVPP